jgi:hypothetical protein
VQQVEVVVVVTDTPLGAMVLLVQELQVKVITVVQGSLGLLIIAVAAVAAPEPQALQEMQEPVHQDPAE